MEKVSLLREYDPEIFHELNAFHMARKTLTQIKSLVELLGDIVTAHDLQEHIGVNLLHKHFDLEDGEYILRRSEGRGAKMRPNRGPRTGSIQPYLWQFAVGDRGRHFYPLEFMDYDASGLHDAMNELDLITANEAFLHEFATSLWDMGLEDVFGIAALGSRHRTDLRSGETMMETTDAANRVLSLEPMEEALIGSFETTETLWVFGKLPIPPSNPHPTSQPDDRQRSPAFADYPSFAQPQQTEEGEPQQ